MRTHRILTVVALVAISFGARDARAQGIADGGGIGRPHTREGFWFGLGLGAGSLGCEDCDDRETSWSGNLKLGGTVTPRFLLGLETNGWYKSESGVTLTYGNLSAVGYFYPSESSGFYLKVGAGVANLRAEIYDLGNDSESGPGGVAGLGYDVRVGNNFSLTPYLNFMMGSFNGSTANVVQAGLGLTWH